MKKIRRLCLTALLTFAFATATSASTGLIECGVTPPPPTQSRAGEIECGKLGVGLTETIYAALQGVWMVF